MLNLYNSRYSKQAFLLEELIQIKENWQKLFWQVKGTVG